MIDQDQLMNQTYFNEHVLMSPIETQLKETAMKTLLLIILLFGILFVFARQSSWFVFGLFLVSVLGILLSMGILRMKRMYALHHAVTKQELFQLYLANPQPLLSLKVYPLNEHCGIRGQIRGEGMSQARQDRLEATIQSMIEEPKIVKLLLSIRKTKNVRDLRQKEQDVYNEATLCGIQQDSWYFDVVSLQTTIYYALPIEKNGVPVLYYLKGNNDEL